ncbi:Radial spoke head protein 6-like protein A [Sciurus carolinensis]|uniref:Radial spoke head protein 6-like protein A n=1 Tax=Sciurus carolinensis TaxID=30640 RepID=A0AA41MUC8_SCICA|nr:Radial spoke head protein 6-like protein A [Sciurus carolinensis]
MGDSPPNPEAPSQQQSSSRRSSQVSERQRSREPSQSQAAFPDEAQQVLLGQQRGSRGSRLSQDFRASQINLRWSQGGNLPEDENLPMYQAEEGGMGGMEYQPMSAGFPMEFQTQTYLDESGTQAGEQATSLMQQLQRLQQGQGGFFQQLESPAYPGANVLGQFSMYQRDDPQFMQNIEHGPYLRDDPALQFSPSELGFMNFGTEMPEPEPRELAVQNAKAYLLQTSINCDLSL